MFCVKVRVPVLVSGSTSLSQGVATVITVEELHQIVKILRMRQHTSCFRDAMSLALTDSRV